MKILLSKKIVVRNVSLRLIAFLCCSIGIAAVWNWQSKEVTTRFLINVPDEPKFVSSEQNNDDDSNKCFIEGSHDAIELLDANLIGIKFRNAKFTNAHIINSEFRKADFRSSDFSGAIIYYSGFSETNFAKANLSRSKIHGSDFTDANLSDTKLFRAYLIHSGFSNANLKNANLKEANLGDADLKTAIGLTYNQIEQAVINEFTILPPYLESKKEDLLKKSLQTEKRLKRQLSISDYDTWKHPFFNLD